MGCVATKVEPIVVTPFSPQGQQMAPIINDPRQNAYKSGGDESTMPDGSCVIAIDFGTSRSAFAYGFVGGRTTVTLGVPTESMLSEGTAVKAETSVVLDKSHKAIAFGLRGRKSVYAENKGVDMYLFQWFKMHLADIANDADEALMVEDHKGLKVSLFVVISEALAYIAQSALDMINASIKSTYHFTDIYWAITVPAIWSPAASGFMRRAAMRAKLIQTQLSQKLTLVREPEAACMDLLEDIDKKDHPVNIAVGAEMLILDCGGGTNDMTFIKILCKEPMRCQELKEAAGGKGGAARIDDHLRALIQDLFGEKRFHKMKALPVMIELMDLWEQFKVMFDGERTYALKLNDLNEEYMMECPEDIINGEMMNKLVLDYNNRHPPSERISNNRFQITIPNAILRKWFDSVITVITQDLDTQLRHKSCLSINYLYLVGGFSANKYLVQRVTAFVKDVHYSRNITIVPAKCPDVAIVRGAVISLLRNTQPLIEDHVSKCCYGIKGIKRFNPAIHDINKSFVAGDGERSVSTFVVFVAKGDRLALNYTTQDHVFYPVTHTQTNVNLELYTLEDDNVRKDTIIYMDDPRVRKMAALLVTLNLQSPYDDRCLNVSIKFGMETQVLAKDKFGKIYTDAKCEFYAST